MRNIRHEILKLVCVFLVATGGVALADNISPYTSILFQNKTAGIVFKQGANGLVGTFVCTSAGSITVANTNVAATDAIIISMGVAGGTISTAPAVKTLTAGTSFVALCATSDTATYNYAILKNAA